MKKISGIREGLPIFQVGKNFFTGPNSEEAVRAFKKEGVKTIISSIPARHAYGKSLKRFAKKHGVGVIFFNEENYRTRDFSLFVAKKVFELSKTRKVAVCCITGAFSRYNVAKDYLKLHRNALASARRRAKAKLKPVVRLKRFVVGRHK